MPVTAVIDSAVQVAFGALTSSADGAIVKLARLGTVNAPPSGLADDEEIGVPMLLPTVDEPVADSGVGDSLGAVETLAGWLTEAADSDADGTDESDAGGLGVNIEVRQDAKRDVL
jgi:hypothetical protein